MQYIAMYVYIATFKIKNKIFCNYSYIARYHIIFLMQCAYETAKSVVLNEAMECLQNNLFKLVQTEDEMKCHNHELMLSCKMLLNCIQEDETIHRAAVNQIYQVTM